MTQVHRLTDSRACGATTVVVGQSTVFVNGLLASVDRDPNNHGAGCIYASTNQVYVEGKMIVEVGDDAAPDNLCPGDSHCNPRTTTGSPNVFVGS